MAKESKNEFIDIKAIWEKYRSKWYYFLISVILCCGLAFVYIKVKSPTYGVKANVLISQQDKAKFDLLAMFGGSGSVQDEIFIISSHSVLHDVARDLEVNKTHVVRPGFMPGKFVYKGYPVELYPEANMCDTLRSSLTFVLKVKENGTADVTVKANNKKIKKLDDAKFPITLDTSYGKFVLNTTPDYKKGDTFKTAIMLNGYDATAEYLAQNVYANIADKKSNVIHLGMNTTDPTYGMDVLNEMIKKYNERRVDDQRNQNTRTAEFIDERLALISNDLNEAESEIQTYKMDQGIVDVATEASYNMSKKGNLENRVAAAETNLEILNLNREFINDPANAYNLLPAAGNGEGAVASAMETYNKLILGRMQLMNNAKGDNVQLRQITAQIDAMRENIKKSLDKAYDNSYVALRDLKSEMYRTQQKLGNIPTQERAFLNMKRQQEIKQELYLYLLQRREETAMLIANAQPKSMVIDDAYTLIEPLGLSKMMIMQIAFILGLLLPILWFYIKHLTRTKFSTREEFEEITDIPVLGEMCNVDTSESNLVVGNKNYSSAAELFRLMRSNLQFILKEKEEKVVLVTSTVSGEGKSFIAINLAQSLALLGKKVILLGMDIRNPKLREYLNLPPSKGITEYLSSSSVSLNDIIIHNAIGENLDVACAGPVPPNPNELLSSNEVDEMFDELRQMYDYIIVDSAPVGMVGDTFSLSRVADTTIYVCRVNYTTIKDVHFFDSIYETKRLKKMAVVINGTEARRGYGYGYRSQTGNK